MEHGSYIPCKCPKKSGFDSRDNIAIKINYLQILLCIRSTHPLSNVSIKFLSRERINFDEILCRLTTQSDYAEKTQGSKSTLAQKCLSN